MACWGEGAFGQLGLGHTQRALTPTNVPGLSGVVDLVAGSSSTCARDGGGAVRCWGDAADGRLGDGQTASRSVPVAVAW